MVENLKATRYNDSTAISAYSWYNNDSSYKDIYGALYAGTAIKYTMAPAGWHISTSDDWDKLTSFLGDSAGGMLKDTGITYWTSLNIGAKNKYGFKALPGGYKNAKSQYLYYDLGNAGYWWAVNDTDTSTEKFHLAILNPLKRNRIVWKSYTLSFCKIYGHSLNESLSLA
jgi:uncharacterized protein (TIGR02145 family)